MARALSLHVGLNQVDPTHYSGWSGPLNACEADAEDMAAIARSKGMTPTSLLTKQATRKAVTDNLSDAAAELKAGDYFFLTYSGHGGQVKDTSGDETDGTDETWCLYDGQLIDDEIYDLFKKFARGVRVFVLSDSCHSGTVTREIYLQSAGEPEAKPRHMPLDVALKVYRDNKAFYDGIQAKFRESYEKAALTIGSQALAAQITAMTPQAAYWISQIIRREVQASVILISGCQDNQTSSDGVFNGAFTGRLLQVWNNGAFQGNYAQFHQQIVNGMPPSQTPNLFTYGSDVPNFQAQRPFTV
jgi:hypothetical protein